MRKRTGVSLAALALSTIGLSAAYAQDSTSKQKDTYFFSQAYYVVQDNERAIFDDEGVGFRAGFGRQIQDGWYWEANLAHNALENGIGGFLQGGDEVRRRFNHRYLFLLGLVLLVVRLRHHDGLTLLILRPQVLFQPLRVYRNHGAGGLEDGLG